MNILYICNEYTPDLIGGIGSVVKTEAHAMVNRGHKAFVAGTYIDSKQLPVAKEEEEGITIFRWNENDYRIWRLSLLNTLAKWSSRLKLGKITRKLEKVKSKEVFLRTVHLINELVHKEHIDLIELPDYYDDFYRHPFLVPKHPFLVPMIIRVHGSVSFIQYYNNGNVNPRILAADKSLFAQADGISAVSEFSKSFVQEYLCKPRQKVNVIYNPIEDRLFENKVHSPLPIKHTPSPLQGTPPDLVGECSDSQTILFIGKINEAKGAYLMLKAFNEVAKAHPNVKLRMIGEGDIPYAKSLVDSQCSDRVHFTGYLHHEKVLKEIDNASFCVLPSLFENFSMAALEVQARKRALIYTNRASGKELIEDGVNGLLVAPQDIPQMVEKINLLLEDSKLRDRLAEKGYKTCRSRYSTEVIIPQIEHYYQEIIGNHNQELENY